jgi:ribosomal protein L40E
MPNIPPTALAIGALAILYIVIRIWASRAEERRRMAHDERMAKLFAEREALAAASQNDAPPSSIGAVTSDKEPKMADDEKPPVEKVTTVKIRCRACKALNDETAEKCIACGAEL